MRKTWMVPLALGLLVLGATAAWADDLTGRIGLGLGAGIYGLGGGRDSSQNGVPDASNAKLGFQGMPVSLKWGIWRYTTLEFARFSYGFNKSKAAGEESFRTTVRPLTANLIFPLAPGSQLTPYIHVGGGALFWTNTVKDTVSGERTVATGTMGSSAGRKLENTDPMWNVGVGLEYFFGGKTEEERNKSFDVRFTYGTFQNELTDVGLQDNNNKLWVATVGFNWYSRKGAPPPPPPPPPAPEPAPAPAPPPPPPPPPAPEPAKEAPKPAGPCIQEGALEGVYFDFNKAEVKPQFNPTLNDLADKLTKDCPTAELELDGYTDGIGSVAYNMKLGQHRADAVKKYLVDHGVADARLATKSFGKSNPVAPNKLPNGKDNPEGRAKNRRVELHVTKQ
ncbi:MAG TPA: OmpA family protein [Candidatus Saccharimonadales bacterium]|nr:OmpA family protein [Candidatus Saccharimonadales bacterium]